MSNHYFRFKKFTVQQQKAAMKVCTEACLFGAWVADKFQKQEIKMGLDIGAGTGLLSLMLAQKVNGLIYAVEIEPSAAQQTKENFESSAYKQQLQLIQVDIREFTTDRKYDLIISNPPFYANHLKSENIQRNIALHSTEITFDELLSSAFRLLNKSGFFAVLLPFQVSNSFIALAHKCNLWLHEQVLVKQTEKHLFFRSMLLFSTAKAEPKESAIIIKKEGNYSDEFIALLKDYYLYL